MGTIPDPKRTATAEMVPQSVPEDPSASENKKQALDPKLASVSAPQVQPGNLSLKTNGGGINKSSDTSQSNRRRASNSLTSSTGACEKSASTCSTVTSEKSAILPSPAASEKSTVTPSTVATEKSTMTPSHEATEKSAFAPSTAANEKSSVADHKKSNIAPSPVAAEKSTITPSTAATEKSTFSSTAANEKTSMVDHKKSSISSSTADRKKSNITSTTIAIEKSTITPSTIATEKPTFSSSTATNEKSSMADHKKSNITSSTADHKKPEPLSKQDMETGRDLIGGCVSQSHDNSSARVSVSPVAERVDICKTSLSVSALAPSRPGSQTNDTRDKVQSPMEVLVQSTECSTKGTSEYLQAPHSERNVRQRSDQASPQTRTTSLAPTTKQEKTAEVGTSHKDPLPSAQLKDYKDGVSLPCFLPKSPVQARNRPEASEREATGSILGSLPLEKREKPESVDAARSKVTSVSSATPAPAHKAEPSVSPNHPCTLPQSSPGGLLSKGDIISTVAGAPQAPGATAEEAREARQWPGSQYKEAATMTVSTEPRGSTSKHSSHDAGVQAVANVCSRSVGTSPGLFSAGGILKVNGMTTESQETLTVTCQKGHRSAPVYKITMDDSWSSQSGILSDVCSQTIVSSQIHRESSLLTSKQICDHLPGQAQQTAGQSKVQTTEANHSEPALKSEERGQGATPKEPVDTTTKWLPLLQPVYQINIEPCTQSNATSNASPCDKEPPVTDSTCQHETGTEIGSGGQQGARGCFPGNVASNNASQSSAGTVAPSTWSVKPPAARSSPSHVDSLLPGALTTAESEEDEKEVVEGKRTTSKLNQGPNQQAPKKEDGRVCKSGQSTDGGKKKKKEEESERSQEVGDEQSQASSRGKAGKAKGIHDVVWDEQGMTWEVYGASADPESLGFAIQNHLQSKIKEQERLIKAQVERRKSEAAASPAGKRSKRRRPRMFRSLVKNVRRPHCCARPPPSSVLE